MKNYIFQHRFNPMITSMVLTWLLVASGRNTRPMLSRRAMIMMMIGLLRLFIIPRWLILTDRPVTIIVILVVPLRWGALDRGTLYWPLGWWRAVAGGGHLNAVNGHISINYHIFDTVSGDWSAMLECRKMDIVHQNRIRWGILYNFQDELLMPSYWPFAVPLFGAPPRQMPVITDHTQLLKAKAEMQIDVGLCDAALEAHLESGGREYSSCYKRDGSDSRWLTVPPLCDSLHLSEWSPRFVGRSEVRSWTVRPGSEARRLQWLVSVSEDRITRTDNNLPDFWQSELSDPFETSVNQLDREQTELVQPNSLTVLTMTMKALVIFTE